MSAINVLIQTDRVHLYTDAAIYQPDGQLSGIGPKVRMMPHINAAIAMRGSFLGLAPIAEELSAAPSFDKLRGGIVDCLKKCVVAYGHLLDQCNFGPNFEVVIAGISETGRPVAYLVASHDRHGEPWSIVDLDGLSATPAPDVVHQRIYDIAAGRNADQLDPVADGLAIMEAQRAAGEGAFVGGFAQLTTIDADGVHSRVIHRFPDRLGEKVAA